MNLALYVVALVTAAACVIVGVAVVRALQDDDASPLTGSVQVEELDESSDEEQERFGDIIEAASAQTTAFINIRYDDAETTIEKVKAGATGDFLEQYTKSTDGLLDLLERNRSVRTGEVVWAGVVSADDDSATVIVATTGTVAHNQTDNKPVAETYRLRLDLVKQDDTWLTNNIEFVA
jgi:Mce-associated membrane protein